MLLVILCGNIVAETCCDYIVLLYCYREMLLVLLVWLYCYRDVLLVIVCGYIVSLYPTLWYTKVQFPEPGSSLIISCSYLLWFVLNDIQVKPRDL